MQNVFKELLPNLAAEPHSGLVAITQITEKPNGDLGVSRIAAP
jgi:hypothetical protein